MALNHHFIHRSQQDLAGFWRGDLRLNPALDVKAPALVTTDFYVPLPWTLQVEHLKWPSPEQELSGVVTPVQNQNFREWNRKFAEGTIIYRKTLYCQKPNGRRVFLVFEGSNYRTEVKLNGQRLPAHEGGHLAFEYEVTQLLKEGDNDFEITVDNLRRKDACPQEQFNWQNYGGIYRPMYLEHRPAQFIRLHRLTPVRDGAGWHVNVEVAIDAPANAPGGGGAGAGGAGSIEVQLQSGEAKASAKGAVVGGLWKGRLSLPGKPRVWQAGVGGLSDYRIAYVGPNGTDEVRGMFGLRTVELKGFRIHLNGEPIRILGAAWHEQHPAFGNAVPAWQAARDIELMKHVGLNAVRIAHYPHARGVYETCDRMGMLCVVELPCWQFNAHHFANPALRDFCVDYARQMVEQMGNHPSIIGWSVQNESETYAPGAVEFFGPIAAMFKTMDPSRVTMSAEGHKPPEHLSVNVSKGQPVGPPAPTHAIVDIFSTSAYPGWYGEKSDFLPKLMDHIHAELPEKPLIVMEFGAEGILGQRSLTMAPWTEDYQAELIARNIPEILKRDFMIGFFLWLFIDYEAASITIRGINAKGLVDEYRRPKLAFNAVKAVLEKWRTEQG